MKEFTLWEEGYRATGEHGTAHCLGTYSGETLMDAYLAHVKKTYGDKVPDYVRLNEPVIWGCRVFDNEADARKSFG